MEWKYYKEYNDIKKYFWDVPENRNNYNKFANALDNMIYESFRAEKLQNDLSNIINFYKSMPKDIQLYYLHMGLISYNTKKLIILPYFIIENIKYIDFSRNEVYIFDCFKSISNQDLIIFLIGIENLLPYIFLYKNIYNNTVIHNN